MLLDTQYMMNSKQLVVSYVNKDGDIKMKYFPWEQPLRYEVCEHADKNKHPKYKSWDKKAVKQVPSSYPDRYAIYEYLDALPQSEQDIIFEYNEPSIFFIDIEVEVVDGFPNPQDAPTKIQSLSIVYDDKIILLGLEDMPDDMKERIRVNTNEYFKDYDVDYKLKYIKYDDEFDMLYAFFNKMVGKMSLITGWNFIDFDWTFLINRARKLSKTINGREYRIDPRASSHTRRLETIWGTEYEVPKHRGVFDYMQLYQALDTSVKVKESSSLDFVSDKVLGLQKIKYTGSLMKLYEDDWEKFMYYNCVDSVLVQLIHQKMNYISVIYAISSLAKIKMVDVYSQMNGALASLAITEGVLRRKFRENDNIVLFKDKTKNNSGAQGIAGGWVKEPNKGLNQWVACYDFASLYPTTQRQFFIAPENYKGKQDSKNKDFCISTDGDKIAIDFDKDVVCVNGTVFKKKKSPTLQMLEDVYAERKKYKKVMMTKAMERDKLKKELELLEKEIALGE